MAWNEKSNKYREGGFHSVTSSESKQKETILFYILVPVYKAEQYIRNCIESVLNQSYKNYILILVDDGSPDKSGMICDEYASIYPNVIVVHQENRGALSARQKALQMAKYDYSTLQRSEKIFVVYLDSDDTLKPFALEHINLAIIENKCDMVVYGYDVVLSGEIVREYDKLSEYSGLVNKRRKLYKVLFNNEAYNSLCRKAISFSLISESDLSKYYCIKHGEDLIESLVYLRKCKCAYFLNESLYNYTINYESVTHSVTPTNFKIDFTVRQKVFEFLEEENVFTDIDWIEYRTYCIKLICTMIIRILMFRMPIEKKINLLKEIRTSDYFRTRIFCQEYDRDSLGKKNTLIYSLFCRNMDRIMIWGYSIYNKLLVKRKGLQCKAELLREVI